MTSEVLLIIIMIVVALAAMIFIPQWRTKRAVAQVIRIFRERSANSIKNAQTFEELRLKLPGMMDGIVTRRDYKRYALRALMQAGIVQTTPDGKLYLLEEKLLDSKLYKS